MSRLNTGTMVALIVAVFLSVCGAYLARQLLLVQDTPAPQGEVRPPEKWPVPVATVDLPAGRQVARGDVGTLYLSPEEAKSRNLPPVYMTDSSDITGRFLREEVKAGSAFSPDCFYPEGTGPSVASDLSPGMRAVTVRVSDSGLVDGFASPSTMVDVLFKLASGTGGEASPAMYTVLEAVQVLAVDRESFPGSQNDPREEEIKVTLAVTPQQAAQLKVLEGNGELSLALRSADEKALDVLQGELVAAEGELEEMKAEAETLTQILDGAAKLGAEFDDKGRAEELATAIPAKETLVADLQGQIDAVLSRPKVQHMVDVLQMNQRPSIADKLPKGMRAVTIAVDDTGLVDGYAMPGSSVDVLFRLAALDGRSDYQETTFTVLEGVQVVAVDRSTEAVLPGPGLDRMKVTLAVTPSQATKLKVIEGRGDLSLALRSLDDAPVTLAATEAARETERDKIASSLDDLRMELEELLIEQEALERIQLISEKRGVPFQKADRLQQLAQLIAVRKEELDEIDERLSSLESVSRVDPAPTTITEVLGIPAPAPIPQSVPAPTKEVEIYLGGARQTVVFEYQGGTNYPTSTSSAVGCKNCGKQQSVVRRSL